LTTATPLHRFQILGAALLFSTGGAAIKSCAFTGWQIACLRSGIAAIAVAVALPQGRKIFSKSAIAVGVAYAATLVLYVNANKLTTAANTIFLQSTAPLYLLLLGPWLLKEKNRQSDFFLVLFLAGGMALFFVGIEPPRVTAPAPLTGNLLGAMAGVTWAFTVLGLRWHGSRGGGGAEASVVAGNLIACAICIPWAFPLSSHAATDWWLIAYLGVFQIGLAYVWLTRGVRHVPALETSLLILLEPVLSAVWAWWIHGEQPGAWALTGCTVILLSTAGYTILRR